MARTPNIKLEEANNVLKENAWQNDTNQLIRLVRFIVGPAEEVARLVGASNRETIYSWAAYRGRPEPEQERKLNTIAALAALVNEECGIHPGASGQYLRSFNYQQNGVDEKNRLERLVEGEIEPVFEETVQHFIESELK
jgi:hypothetical protein